MAALEAFGQALMLDAGHVGAQLGLAHILAAYDYRNILESAYDWRKRNHLGLEVAFPILSIYAGLYQSYLTFGAGFDLFFFRINAVSYATELGTLVGQDPNRRYQLRFDFKFNL